MTIEVTDEMREARNAKYLENALPLYELMRGEIDQLRWQKDELVERIETLERKTQPFWARWFKGGAA